MYLMPGTSTMHMCYALNNNWNSCYTHTKPFELNEWYNIKVAQADFQMNSLIKCGASSRWLSSLYCPMRTSDRMAIGKTQPTLL